MGRNRSVQFSKSMTMSSSTPCCIINIIRHKLDQRRNAQLVVLARQAPKPDKYLRTETTASNTLCVQPSPSQPHRPSYLDHPPYVPAPLRPAAAAMSKPRSTTTSPPHHQERTVLTRRRRAGRRRDRLLRHRSPHTPSPRPQGAPCDPQPPEHRRAAPPTRPRPSIGLWSTIVVLVPHHCVACSAGQFS